MSDFDLSGRVAVVTGGASGIGRAIALSLAKHGAMVWVLDLDSAAAAVTVKAITDTGGRAMGIECDVANPETVSRVFTSLACEGQLDILINSAGIAHIGTIETTSPMDFERIFKVNV